jgi:hypothetical protein
MRTRAKVVVVVLFGALLAGCSGTGAPSGWLPTAEATQEEAHGAWITVRRRSLESREVLAEGELIAVHEDSLFVLVSDGPESELVAVPRAPDIKAKVGTFDPKRGGLVAWTLLGSVSTVSHGVNLIFTLPIWIITGTVVGNNAGAPAIEHYPDEFVFDSFDSMRVYARFPQGLMNSIDRAVLEPRLPAKLTKDPPPERRGRR